MDNYLALGKEVLDNGVKTENRTGVSTVSKFGGSLLFDLSKGFPAPTTKKGYFKGAAVELCWMLKGMTNVQYLNDHGVKFWNQWAVTQEDIESHSTSFSSPADKFLMEDMSKATDARVGDLGPVYGQMIRQFPNPDGTTTDQLDKLIQGLKTNPMSRRHIVDLWHPFYLPDESISPQENVLNGKQALAPCHMLWTFMAVPMYTEEERRDIIRSNIYYYKMQGNKAVVELESKRPGGVLDDEEYINALLYLVPKYKLNLHFQMRSSDYPAGCPVNIMFYALLLELVALHTGMVAGELLYTATNVHIYEDQIEPFTQQLEREPRELPTLSIGMYRENIWDHEPSDFTLRDYNPADTIKYPVAK